MTIKSVKEIIIYESPDGGKTVYSRKSGSSDRTLIKEDPSIHWKAKWIMWQDILQSAETNTTLADAIHKAEMIYVLTKKQS
jgi:hypothetical protein